LLNTLSKMKNVIKRSEFQFVVERLNDQNFLIQAIVGPRQVGKSTLVRQVLEESGFDYSIVSADAIPNANSNWLLQQWELARLKFNQTNEVFVLAIDEIQKVGNWSEIVKKCWDEDRLNNCSIKVVILGSSQLLMQKGLTESLAGRFEVISLTHWRYNEMKEAFDFTPEQYVWFGAYPGAATFIEDEVRWKQYIIHSFIEPTISKDILMLGRIDKPALLRRMFELGSNYSGQILSMNKVLGKLQDAGNTTTLSHYLTLLEHAGLLSGLQKFAMDSARQKSSSPKFQIMNPALSNALSIESFDSIQKNPALWGRAVESAIGAYLLTFRKEGYTIYYWRQGDKEVDFIITYKDKVVALEVKTGKENYKGMETFVKLFSPNKTYIIGSTGIDWKEFLSIHVSQLF